LLFLVMVNVTALHTLSAPRTVSVLVTPTDIPSGIAKFTDVPFPLTLPTE
jgi:hypothetical protein